MRKITTLNPDGKTRARMIEEYQAGATAADLAKKYGYEKSTVHLYIREYEQHGPSVLNKERRPRETVHLTPAQWRAHLDNAADEREREYLTALMDVSKKIITLNQAAARCGITPQGLMKIRRKYC